MKKTALVIMAAGIGSRFGGGIKQLAKVGPGGEIIMDYSIHDALAAGFNKIVFIIRKDIEKDFREIIGDRIEKLCEVEYAFQQIDALPEGFSVPEGRAKPWGTGHAILVAKDVIKEPFAVINADDYYGKEAFKVVHDYLVDHADDEYKYCMAGFILKNTLSENGGVTRGVCKVDDAHYLVDVTETGDIQMAEDGSCCVCEGGNKLDADSYVSMNMWGLTPEFLDELEKGFPEFLKTAQIKSEYLLPGVVSDLLHAGKATVQVLETQDKWFGVTYAADKQSVMDAFEDLLARGVYTSPLNK